MIRIRNLKMTYVSGATSHTAVRDLSLDVPEGHFYTLLGPSGCGKTTTLRCVAGLERPDSGEITIDGNMVFSSAEDVWVPPNFRRIGMVFQSYAIWPHMTVFDNVAFPLRHQRPRPPAREVREKVLKALELVQLESYVDRPAPFLSGGQQQRLALARAIVNEPRVLLLDEPLSNLDAKLRDEMRLELRALLQRLGITTLFVTHEQIEALTMSDTIAVMSDGVIVQQGSPSQIYREPGAVFVADFIGKTNFIPATVIAGAGTAPNSVDTPVGVLACSLGVGARAGEALTIAVRPEYVELAHAAGEGANRIQGEVEDVVFLGNMIDCIVRVRDYRMRVHLHPSREPQRGATVWLHLPPEHCLVMAG